MRDGRQRHDWEHTSHVLWIAAEVAPKAKGAKRFSPADFNPYAETRPTRGIRITADNISILKAALSPKRLKELERRKAEQCQPG